MINPIIRIFISIAILVVISCSSKEELSKEHYVPLFIGSYTQKEAHVDGKGVGIYIYDFDTLRGTITYRGEKNGIVNPSYVATKKDLLVSVSEVDSGEIVSYKFDPESYDIEEISRQFSYGAYPCFVSISSNEVFVANYGGTISCYTLSGGGILTHRWYKKHVGSGKIARQESAHPHMITTHPHNKELLVSDLGMNALVLYLKSTTGYRNKAFIGMPVGAGPRHFEFNPVRSSELYVLNELNATVSFLKKADSLITYEIKRNYPLIKEATNSEDLSASAIEISPNGKYLYTAVRGKWNQIVSFKILKDGYLQKLEVIHSNGKTPREIKIDPSGRYLLVGNQDSDSVTVFNINEDGTLKPSSQIEVLTPVSFAFML